MFENQIKDVAEKSTEEGIDPALVARAVAESAYQISLDKNATTPFMLASSKSKRHRSGGKVHSDCHKSSIYYNTKQIEKFILYLISYFYIYLYSKYNKNDNHTQQPLCKNSLIHDNRLHIQASPKNIFVRQIICV
nr:hypothetical protein CFP56_16420 [Quercus suber]